MSETDYRDLSPEQCEDYLGYVVCRPRDLELVGRTMLRPPPELPVLTAVTDNITFFGQPLSVTGVPFMQQDERLGVCANIVAWIVHYSGFRRGTHSRRLIAEFLNRTSDFFRPKASIGLTPLELVLLLDSAGFRCEFFERDPEQEIPLIEYPWHDSQFFHSETKSLYDIYGEDSPPALTCLDPSPTRESLHELRSRIVEECCRNLNSGFPIVVNGVDHTVVVCGYKLLDESPLLAQFVVHDDQVGPYVGVADCLFDRTDLREAQAPEHPCDPVPELKQLTHALYDPDTGDQPNGWFDWVDLIVPLPPLVFLPLHAAERAAFRLLQWNLLQADDIEREDGRPPPEMVEILQARDKDKLRFRSYLIQANHFKQLLRLRGAAEILSRQYRSLRLSEWIAVVEFVDTRGSLVDHLCLGEAIFDATSNPKNPWVHALRLGKAVSLVYSDGRDRAIAVDTTSMSPGARPYSSLRRLRENECRGEGNEHQTDELKGLADH